MLAPIEAEGVRITVTGTGSLTSEAVEGCTLPWRCEVPQPVWHETLNLSEEEDSLLEAPWQVSSIEKPPMEMTS